MTALERETGTDRRNRGRWERRMYWGYRGPRHLNGHIVSTTGRETRYACIIVIGAVLEGRGARGGIAKRGRYDGEGEVGVAHVGSRLCGTGTGCYSCTCCSDMFQVEFSVSLVCEKETDKNLRGRTTGRALIGI